jgi:hypothetical protein
VDEDEDFADEARDDYLFEKYGPGWADDHAAEIAQDYQASGLQNVTPRTHRELYPPAQAELVKAKARLADGEYDEAVFHAGKALDGYASAVFIAPIRELLVEPLRNAFPHARMKTDTILGKVTGLESGFKFARVIIAATRDQHQTGTLISELQRFIDNDAEGNWFTRNATVHQLRELKEAEAASFIANAEAFLERLADPLEAVVQAENAAQSQPRGLPFDF